MSGTPIDPSWDREKVRAVLDSIQAEIDRLQVVADAFQQAAERADRDVWDAKSRLKSMEELFAAPVPQRRDAR